MPRLTIALVALAGILAGALGVSLTNRADPALDSAAVRTIVAEALDAQNTALPTPAAIDPATLNPLIEDYLLANPRVLQRMSNALTAELQAEQKAGVQSTLAEYKTRIYDDPDHVVLGNPQGDVTLVELFDYNCGYCRQALPDLAALLAEDDNLKVILKEFPILSQGSEDAARIAYLVGQSDADYWSFHEALFTSRGQIDKATALEAAKSLGLNPITLEMEMGSARVSAAIQKSYEIAGALNITGTPSYIIGDEVIPGAVGIDELRTRIANMRACGATSCTDTEG